MFDVNTSGIYFFADQTFLNIFASEEPLDFILVELSPLFYGYSLHLLVDEKGHGFLH